TSINVNFYLDPSNYYPHGADYRAFSILRSFAGPIALVVALAVVLPAFSGMNAVAAGALCLSVLTVGPRVRETDANLRSAAEQVTAARQAGRADINRAVHAHLMQPVGFLYRTLEQNPDIDRRFFDDVRNINGAIREILALDLSADRDLTWPGVLVGRAEEILDERGMRTHLDVSDDPIGDTDRKVARMVFDEFLMNAVKADAEEARAALLLNEGRWVLSVTDNGTPIDADMWLRPHGGLARLQLLLRHHGGRIELLGPKTVCAAWPATKECDLL
ncbi:MAG: hypothetical protein L0H03_11390, partial [Rhodococcus sp. (in: high G+C Gram-positive bacteria)]|nr:hypothetical protein [Rhodococcus sp. (in: high G+C Gram-positive bacteria)]